MATEAMERSIAQLQADYERSQGKPFNHFFCPILLRDEDRPLCMGHVVPESYPNCCRARVPQRADVDNWFGAMFEADYGVLLRAQRAGDKGMVFDDSLRGLLKPSIQVNGEECRHYDYRGTKSPRHVGVTLEHETGEETIELVLAKLFKLRFPKPD